MSRIAQLLAEMEAQGRQILGSEKVDPADIEVHTALDLRYVGQWHELTLQLDELDPERIAQAFNAEHDLLFGYSTADMPVEVLACRVTTTGTTRKPEHGLHAEAGADAEAAQIGERPVWSPVERRKIATPVYDGRALPAVAALSGPAIVELANTTIVVLDGFELLVDRFGSFVLYAGERGRERSAALVAEVR
jgi:N-methylhydantoinase A